MKSNHGWRGSILDLFLVMLLILGPAGAVMRYRDLRIREEGVELATYRVRAVMQSLPRETAECAEEGARLYTAAGEYVGTVAAVTLSPTTVRLWRNGVLLEEIRQDGAVVDAEVELELDGSLRNGVLLWGGRYPMPAGGSLLLYSDRLQWELLVLSYRKNGVEP